MDNQLNELVDLAYEAFCGIVSASPKWGELTSREKEAWRAAISSVRMKLETEFLYRSKRKKK